MCLTTTSRSRLVTASSLATFRDCARRYHYSHILQRVRQTESHALQFGKLMHAALAAWWQDGPTAAVAYLTGIADQVAPVDAAKIAAMLRYYDPPRADYTMEAIEHEFVVPIRNPVTGRSMRAYRLGGKVDGLVRDVSGHRWILEHKTTSDQVIGFGPYWQRLAIDHQITLYAAAHDARGVLYDVLRKPTLKLCKKDEYAAKCTHGVKSPEDVYRERCEAKAKAHLAEVYQFRPVHFTDQDLTEARTDLWQQCQILRRCERDGFWPRNSGSCRGFYGLCPYLDVCTNRASLDDDTLFRTKESANEELEAVA